MWWPEMDYFLQSWYSFRFPTSQEKKNKFTEISFNANTDYLQYVNPLRNEIINSSEQTLVTQPEAK